MIAWYIVTAEEIRRLEKRNPGNGGKTAPTSMGGDKRCKEGFMHLVKRDQSRSVHHIRCIVYKSVSQNSD